MKKGDVVFLTRYALTEGISEHVIDIVPDSSLWVCFMGNYKFYNPKTEVFVNKKDAIKKAEEMRKRKIESLEKKIEKLRNMKF